MSHVGHSNDQLFLECNKAREMLYGALEMRNKALEMHVGDISNTIASKLLAFYQRECAAECSCHVGFPVL